MDFSPLYSDLSEDARAEIEALPRSERLVQIATLQNRSTRELVAQIAAMANLPVLNEIELIDNPTATLPLRLIHEYQCVPVRKAVTTRRVRRHTCHRKFANPACHPVAP